ncbi:DUF551 domain-containing protein [Anaerobutyricum hallii]|uniref:DUF551 domain-containing protein n=1 Tax=Anaerobutyricum hallii TaxID=39488 RepID=UPI000E70F6EB|nr:DUF551 domain-containing protein [Anaerobutyricum hallii]RJW41965.1 DUF551 domain-containing protein [Lachnospiraceae bacterium TF09-5]
MDRLTIPDEPIEGGMRRTVIDARTVRENAMTIYWRLKAYEDTGLTPEEIMDGRLLSGWISVAEQLPENGEIVLVTRKYRNEKWYVEQDEYYEDTGFDSGADEDIIAWMPLPEPYRVD